MPIGKRATAGRVEIVININPQRLCIELYVGSFTHVALWWRIRHAFYGRRLAVGEPVENKIKIGFVDELN